DAIPHFRAPATQVVPATSCSRSQDKPNNRLPDLERQHLIVPHFSGIPTLRANWQQVSVNATPLRNPLFWNWGSSLVHAPAIPQRSLSTTSSLGTVEFPS